MNKELKFDEYYMRLIQSSDIEIYYENAIVNLSQESRYFTGTLGSFSKEIIRDYLEKNVSDSSRYDFLIFSGEEVVGEVVLSDIEDSSCHYRICLYNKKHFSKGIGRRASQKVFEFAFNELDITTIDLEVYPFNERGIHLYKQLGFIETERIMDHEADEPYREIIVMELVNSDDL